MTLVGGQISPDESLHGLDLSKTIILDQKVDWFFSWYLMVGKVLHLGQTNVYKKIKGADPSPLGPKFRKLSPISTLMYVCMSNV